jgi:hypothetical protein
VAQVTQVTQVAQTPGRLYRLGSHPSRIAIVVFQRVRRLVRFSEVPATERSGISPSETRTLI